MNITTSSNIGQLIILMDDLPEELVTSIIVFIRSDARILACCGRSYYRLFRLFITYIEQGNMLPEICFDRQVITANCLKDFEYPFRNFLSHNDDWKRGCWDMNNKRDITNDDKELFKRLVYGKWDMLYCLQTSGDNQEWWFLLAKVGDYYISFDASTGYTGFMTGGGGDFGYSTDWKTLWNNYSTKDLRNTVMISNGYQPLALK